jgi:hypothetical protein
MNEEGVKILDEGQGSAREKEIEYENFIDAEINRQVCGCYAAPSSAVSSYPPMRLLRISKLET